MNNYTEEELLMLSNFVYLDVAKSDKTILEIISEYKDDKGNYTAESVKSISATGGITELQVASLFEKMENHIKNNNPQFGEISKARMIDEGGIRAVLYTDEKNNNPVLAIRGTGGSKEAWTDNVLGGFEDETRMQKLAAEFVQSECSVYSDITVCGHSKGGNLAQYVTITSGDSIDRCVTFDNQGFNEKFIKDNKENIEKSKDKMKEINAHNDFVSILLTPIAGEVIYVENKGKLADAHSSYYLLDSNEFDENGNFINIKKQDKLSKKLKEVSDDLVKKLSKTDDSTSCALSVGLGNFISSIMETENTAEGIGVTYGTAAFFVKNYKDKLNSLFKSNDASVKIVNEKLFINFNGIKSVPEKMNEIAQLLAMNSSMIDDIKDDFGMYIVTDVYTDIMLGRISEKLLQTSNSMTVLAKELISITKMYEDKEKSILTLF